MGVLDQVLAYKQKKEAEQSADLQAIPQAMMLYQQGKQQAYENQIKGMLAQATLAKSGFIYDQKKNTLTRDPSLNQGNVLDQILKAQKINTLQAKENLYGKMMKEDEGGGDPEAILDKASKSSGFGKEDFNVKPITRMVAGVPHTAYVPELKNQLPAGLEKEYRGFAKVGLGLSQNLKMLQENPEFEKLMNPANIKAMRPGTLLGNIGNFLLKIDPKSKDFATFKAESDKTFQAFRKETTGAQAALAELGWLAPDYPEPTDNPELYKKKAITALERIAEGEKLLLDYWGSQGYRTSKLREIDSPASKTLKANSGESTESSKLEVGGMFQGKKILKVKQIG